MQTVLHWLTVTMAQQDLLQKLSVTLYFEYPVWMVPCLSPTSFPTSINSASQGESALNKTTIGPWSKSQEPYGSSWLCFSKKYPWLWPSKSANTHGLPQEELKRVRSRVESRQGARKKFSKPMLLFSALLARFFQNVLESSVVFVGGLLAPWLSWRAAG